jgi:hypothetical protein
LVVFKSAISDPSDTLLMLRDAFAQGKLAGAKPGIFSLLHRLSRKPVDKLARARGRIRRCKNLLLP